MAASLWQQYIADVKSGARNAGPLEVLTVQRFERLCQNPKYYFDTAEAERVISIVQMFRHTKGKYAGKLFSLFPWQAFFFAYIFGLKRRDNDLRVVRKVLLCMAKKGGKSEIAGALAIIMTFFDGEHGAECYSAANKYDQAMFSWDAAKEIIKRVASESNAIDSRLKLYESQNTRSIICLDTNSFFRPLANEHKTLDGVNPHLAIIDEYHEARDTLLVDNLESGMVSREQPLLCIITTRGFNRTRPLGQLEKTYTAILNGVLENDAVFPMIFAMDDGDDWMDEKNWEKSNPGIGRAPSWEGIREEFQKAITEGESREVSFKTKNLNIWTSTAATWIKDTVWMRGNIPVDAQKLIGRSCYAGLDLAKTRDVTALALIFPPEIAGQKFEVLMYFWIPQDTVRENALQSGVPYMDWARMGLITLTPGDVTDYDEVKSQIDFLSTQYRIQSLQYDPWNATQLATSLYESGIEVAEFAQNARKFNEPLTWLERNAIQGNIAHGGNPILRWMNGNVQLYRDGNDNIKIDKRNSADKVDGMVALGMAIGGMIAAKADVVVDYSLIAVVSR